MNVNLNKAVLSTMTIPQLTSLQASMVDELGSVCPFPKVSVFKDKTRAIARCAALVEVARKDPRFGSGKVDRRCGTNVPPSGEPIKSCLEGSKQAALVDQLARKDGATMDDLIAAMLSVNPDGEYTPKRIRTAFGWDIKSRGYGVTSRIVDGVERFFLVVPEGQAVVPHRARKCPQ